MKLTVNVLPELHQSLIEYAALYPENYGREEPISELIPAMLNGFLDSDRGFQRRRRKAASA